MTFRDTSPRRLAQAFALAGLVACCAACAPDSIRNRQAVGFNAYLDSLREGCRDLRIGPHDVGDWLRSSGTTNDDDYVYWLDQTSRLYYQRITVAQYRTDVGAALNAGEGDKASLDCIIAHLPAVRPTEVRGGM